MGFGWLSTGFAMLLPLVGLAMGDLVIRRARLRPRERLIAAVGVGLLLVFLAQFGLFTAKFGPRSAWLVLGACGVAWVIAGRATARLLVSRPVRGLAWAWVVLAGASVVFVAPLRHLSGGWWMLDWFEHFQRTAYFVGKLPDDFQFIDLYSLPARPPLQNVLTAWVAGLDAAEPQVEGGGQGGGIGERGVVLRFGTFQLASAVLGSLIVLPCAQLAARMAPGRYRRGRMWLAVACAFVLSPGYVAHDLFPWTKLLPTFYVLAAIALYLPAIARLRTERGPVGGWVGGRAPLRGRMVLVAVLLAAGCVTHYSACPFALLIGLHYGWSWFRHSDRRRVGDFLVPAGAGAMLLAVWVGWSVLRFGAGTTFGANTTVSDSVQLSVWDNLGKLASNLYRSFTPLPLLASPKEVQDGIPGTPYATVGLRQNSSLGLLRDYAFSIYTSAIPWVAGSVGGVVLVLGLVQDLLRPRRREREIKERSDAGGREVWFWRYFLVGGVALGVAVHGAPTALGITFVTMVPLAMLAVAYVPARLCAGRQLRPLPMRSALIWLAVLGWLVDGTVGVFPHVLVQTQFFPMGPRPEDAWEAYRAPGALSTVAVGSYRMMMVYGLHPLGEVLAGWRIPLLALVAGVLLGAWGWLARWLVGGWGRKGR